MRYQIVDCHTVYETDSREQALVAQRTPCTPEGCDLRHRITERTLHGQREVWQPVVESSHSVWQEVIRDMQERELVGLRKYGRYLTPESKEMGLREAYEEALDLCVYLRKALIEMEGK